MGAVLGRLRSCLWFGVFSLTGLWGRNLGMPVAWPAPVTPGPAL